MGKEVQDHGNGSQQKKLLPSCDAADHLQSEALQFVESLLPRESNAPHGKRPFESVRGILNSNYDRLDEDIREMRHEAWKNFPRDVEL